MKRVSNSLLACIGLFLFGFCHGCNQSPPPSSTALQRGIQYLVSQQADDHLWHSPNYGNLKDGAAITALVLDALGDGTGTEKGNLQNALDALLPMIQETGYVTNADGPDYTNYASAMLVAAICQLNLKAPDDLTAKLGSYLAEAQLDEAEGFQTSDVDFGGWDLTGWMTGQRPTTGSNISVSTEALEALVLLRSQQVDQGKQPVPQAVSGETAIQQSASWLARMQNPDGGFFFHPQRKHIGNKAGWVKQQERTDPESYGTATADGLRMLTALGRTPNDDSVKQAVSWLVQHKDLSRVPGFDPAGDTASWGLGLRYYYYQSLSQSLALLPEKDGRQVAEQIIKILQSEQNANGSWSNPNARMREDDPYIATSFAIIALRNCESYLKSLGTP